MNLHWLALLSVFWSCWLAGADRKSLSADLTPPQIRKPDSQKRKVIKEGRGAVIQCEADGYPPPTYQWLRNDVAIDDTGDYFKAFSNGTLVFKDFKMRDGGFFQCLAKNKCGTSVSVKFPILASAYIDESFLGGINPIDVSVTEGTPTHLYCVHAPDGAGNFLVRWYRDVSRQEVDITSRVGTDSNGTHHIAYAVNEDAGEYVCGLAPYNNPHATAIYLFDVIHVTVIGGKTELLKPNKEHVSTVVKGTLGQRVELECFFSGYPEPDITWKDNQQQVIQEGHGHYVIDDFGRKLRIEQLREEDEGTYSCTARNGAGSDDARIFLNVTSPPLMLTTPDTSLEKFFKPSGQMATLKYLARAMEGENLEPPVWYRNGELLTTETFPDQTRYSFDADGTELTIKDLDKCKDTACFQCNISNSEGYIFYDGFLKVVGKNVKTKRSSVDLTPTWTL